MPTLRQKLYLNFEGSVFLVTMVTRLYYLSVARDNLRTVMRNYIFIQFISSLLLCSYHGNCRAK